jgi:1A family penicillin-binding protein
MFKLFRWKPRAGGLLKDNAKPKNLHRRLNKRKILRGLLYTAGAFVLLIVLLFAWYAKDLPTPEKIASRRATESTKIFDRNGNPLYETGAMRRTIIPADQMPESIRKATVAIEDKDFYKHHGFDFRGFARALVANIAHGRLSQGGSTITQQYVKNALLSPKKTFTRKIKELILSVELEQTRTKDEILTLYLNEIPYGSNVYGIQEATKLYFNKDAKDLTLAEATTLAALPQRPTYYSPYGTHTNDLFARKNKVLDNMVDQSYITKDQADIAKKEAPNKEQAKFAERKDNIKSPHFVLFVKEKLAELYGDRMVDEGGLQVTTTLDGDMQKMAEEAVVDGSKKLDRYGATNAALVSIDPKTGQVLAMIGSRDYFDTEHDGNVNVTLANRQPGSAFKPIAYATAFKKQYNPAYTLFDLKTDFGGGYNPSDYDGRTRGPVSARFALANSLNIPAVKMLSLAGIDNTLQTAKDLGITTLTDPKRYGLALVLGGGEVKPIELAGAYGAFGNGGKYATTTPFLKIQDSKGKMLYEFKDGGNVKEVLDPQIAYEITDILADNNVRQSIFGNSLVVPGYKVAVKTGTTQEFHDAWTAGTTPDLATVVWVGNNDNSKMKNGADGSVVAAPIFRSYMSKALARFPKTDFTRPAGIQEIAVEKFSNKLPNEYSQDMVKDIFASWQVPTQKDDVNTIVQVNRLNGLLATETTPADLIEQRVYRNLHSERPDLASWEGPVRSWAAANGYIGSPPKDKDDSYNDNKGPQLSVTSPGNGATFAPSDTITINANASATYGIREVRFSAGSLSATDSEAPYSTNFSAASLGAGTYEISVTAVDQNGVSATAKLSVVVNAATHTQSNITVSGLATTSANIHFETSVATTAQVKYSTDQNNLNQTTSDSFNTTSHNVPLSGLTSGTKYYFQVITSAGSSTVTSSVYSFTTS